MKNNLKLWDAHAHLLPPWFPPEDITAVVQRAKDAQLEGIVNVCSSPVLEHYQQALDIGAQFKMIHINIGLQPTEASHDAYQVLEDTMYKYKSQICALGEVGLDYYWVKDKSLHKLQKKIFSAIIELANNLKLPLVIHTRKAEQDSLDILEKEADVKVLLHGLEGNAEILKRVIDLDYQISIPTSLSIRKKYRRNAKTMPLELILLETDSPFQLPFNPPKNEKNPRNEPHAILPACKKVADLHEISLKEAAAQFRKNTKKFFNL